MGEWAKARAVIAGIHQECCGIEPEKGGDLKTVLQEEAVEIPGAERRLRARRFGLRLALIAVSGGVFLGLVGPYGSYLNLGPVARLLYWVTCALTGLGLYTAPLLLARRLSLTWHGGKFWSGVIGLVSLLSLVQTRITRDLALSIWPDLAPHLPGWWQWYGQVLLIALPSVVLVILVVGHSDRAPARDEPTEPQASESARTVRAVQPARVAGDFPRAETILALQMEDHYIRCHQSGGSKLVHGVFRDALSRQSVCEGLQVHRSWWVARKALAGWDGTPRALRLTLINGVSVPVSRHHVAHLREAGWLDEPSDKIDRREASDNQEG